MYDLRLSKPLKTGRPDSCEALSHNIIDFLVKQANFCTLIDRQSINRSGIDVVFTLKYNKLTNLAYGNPQCLQQLQVKHHLDPTLPQGALSYPLVKTDTHVVIVLPSDNSINLEK